MLIDYLRGDGSLQESIDKPRFYNDGGTVYYENATSDEDINTFKSMGYGVKENVMTQTLVVFKVQYIIKMIKLLKSVKMLVIDNGLVKAK